MKHHRTMIIIALPVYAIINQIGSVYTKDVTEDTLPGQPEEGLLEVVVRLGGDVVILKVLLPVEDDRLGLDLPVLDVHLVTRQHDGDVLAHPAHRHFNSQPIMKTYTTILDFRQFDKI